jgi:hypothetical protein
MIAIAAVLLAAATGATPSDAMLIEFSAGWCEHCHNARPMIDRLEDDGYAVRRVDVDKESALADRYNVAEIPTYVVVSGGREVARMVGSRTTYAELAAALQPAPASRLGETSNASSRRNDRSIDPLAPADPRPSDPRPSDPRPSDRFAAASSIDEDLQTGIPSTQAIQRAQAATVRLTISHNNVIDVATGTIIDTHGDEALVLTCGHAFRDSKGVGDLKAELFLGGAPVTVSGRVVDYSAEDRDIALVVIRPGRPVVAAPVVGGGAVPGSGSAAFSFGCDHGADPTRRDTRITAINKFLGPQNLIIAGAPVSGRSGGGLFDSQGRIIGVCNAADQQDDEGVYAGPEVIHWQLDRLNLTSLYRDPSTDQREAMQLASNAANQPRNDANVPSSLAEPMVDGRIATNQTGNDANVREGANAGNDANRGKEVIIIVRDRDRPDRPSQVVELSEAPPEILDLLRR